VDRPAFVKRTELALPLPCSVLPPPSLEWFPLVVWPDLELHRVLNGLAADGLTCGTSLARSRCAACCTIAPR
jgi:hypothetical protein